MNMYKMLTAAKNLVTFLPTTTVFAFQALISSFSNNGKCFTANKYLTSALIVVCSALCFFFSVTDTFIKNNKLYYGIATCQGFVVINSDGNEGDKKDIDGRLRLRWLDYVHAISSVVVFLAFSSGDPFVQKCLFSAAMSWSGTNIKQLDCNLPLGFGVLGSVVFLVLPRTRKSIGYSEDSEPQAFPTNPQEKVEQQNV